MPFAFHYAARSDVGMVRSNNEDSGYAGPHLLAMADGMGGHAGGDVASSTVIGALVRLDGESLGGRDLSHALLDRIHSANSEIGDQVHADPSLDGMGTTLIAMLRAGDKIVLAHIGDSRAFMVRDGVVTQITKDHSFVQNLVDEGRITADEAQTHPQRSLVTRVLTGAHDDEPDLVVRQGRIGDRYVISSDGLTDYVARDTIAEVLTGHRRPGRDRRPARRAGPAGRGARQRHGRRRRPRRHLAQPGPPDPAAGGRCRSGAPERHPPHPDDPGRQGRGAHPAGHRRHGADDDGPTLAEEGPRSRRSTVLRVAAALVVLAVVVAGGSYAVYAWSQQQYYLAVQDGVVTVFRGVDQTLGPVSLSSPDYATTIPVEDLPTSYQDSLRSGIEVEDRAAAEARVAELRLQATACRWAQLNGEACRTVPSTWTAPSPSTSPSPRHGTATPSPSPSPSPTPSRDELPGDLMSVVSSYTPRKGRNVELVLVDRGGGDRAARLPQRRARHQRRDPGRHAHPGRWLPRPGPGVPPGAALAGLLRRPADAADHHPAQRAGPGDDPPDRHRARQVDRRRRRPAPADVDRRRDGRRRRRARRAARPPGAAPLHLPRGRHRFRAAAAAAAAGHRHLGLRVADLDPDRPVLVPAR